jgi:small subunit ribosomal protein S8
MTDPISDMLTRIRNAQKAKKVRVSMPSSKVKVSIAKVLEAEGYIDGVETEDHDQNKATLTLTLRYHEGVPVIERRERANRATCPRFRAGSVSPSYRRRLES